MELVIFRTYHTDGTNGRLYINNSFQCFTIELPWENNLPQYSCIPEGCYSLKKRYSNKFGQHLLVDDVPGRELILVHPANDALKELRGCIAPVSILKGPGKGILSRNAFSRVVSLVYEALKKETVFINIKPDQDESSAKNRSAHSEVL
ncbi:MAG: DUF5675 family protein [Flavisolibacter sp.]